MRRIVAQPDLGAKVIRADGPQGAHGVSPGIFEARLNAAFDDTGGIPIVEETRPTQMWLDVPADLLRGLPCLPKDR